MDDNNIQLKGKIAKFPKNTKASNALKFLETIKVNPNKLWYIIIEDQSTDLKMVKYNRSKGVNLIEYTNNLKSKYLSDYVNDIELSNQISSIIVEGEQDYSVIKNIPEIVLESGQTLISKITFDLINLLADL